MKNQILVIAPHMDDEVLGCGGTIRRHVLAGDVVSVCIVANRAYDHLYNPELINKEKEACRQAQNMLGYQNLTFLDLPDEKLDISQIEIIIPLEEIVTSVNPDIVYLPHRGDINQDHRAVFDAVRVVCRPYSIGKTPILRVYEVPSSTDIVPQYSEWMFRPNLYVDISETLKDKIKAMSCYDTESRVFPHPRSSKGLEILAQKRGMEVGMEAAESFMTIRECWWK